jgi:hypothetical protein
MRDAKNKHTAVVIEKRNNCFMSKTKQNLWEGIFTFYTVVGGWCERYKQHGQHCDGISKMNGHCECAPGLKCTWIPDPTLPPLISGYLLQKLSTQLILSYVNTVFNAPFNTIISVMSWRQTNSKGVHIYFHFPFAKRILVGCYYRCNPCLQCQFDLVMAYIP